MIYLQKGDDSTSASSSKNHNNVGNLYATQKRKARNRRRRNRNKNKNGGSITKPSGTLNEDRSSVEHTIAGDSNNAQSGTVGQKKKQERETDAALATSSETESTDTFQYDSRLKFSSRKMNVDSDGNHMKEAGDQESGMSSCAAGEASSSANRTRKDATLKYEKLFGLKEKGHVNGYTDSGSAANNKQKERAHPPSEAEQPTNTDARIRCREDEFFLIGTGEHTDRKTRKLRESSGVNNDVKTKQGKANMSSPEHKEATSCHRKTADSFRDERLFTFSRKTNKVHSGGADLNDKMDANPVIHNSKKKGPVSHPTDKRFTTNRDTGKETKEREFFRYDRLFNFRTRKQNASADADNEAGTNKTKEKDFFRYDKLFDFSTQKQNVPENADNKSTKNKAEEKDFFRYDKLFDFNTQKQNAPENADKTTTNKTEEKEFFRYDKLFNFSTQKQNVPENADNKSTTTKAEEKDFFRCDKLFDFNTQKQNAPENADKTTTNKTEEKDFFRYDRLFNFSTEKENAADSTDDTSTSSDDSYQYEMEDEILDDDDDDDDTAFHMFCGGMLFILISF